MIEMPLSSFESSQKSGDSECIYPGCRPVYVDLPCRSQAVADMKTIKAGVHVSAAGKKK